jgi:hypothetical protein
MLNRSKHVSSNYQNMYSEVVVWYMSASNRVYIPTAQQASAHEAGSHGRPYRLPGSHAGVWPAARTTGRTGSLRCARLPVRIFGTDFTARWRSPESRRGGIRTGARRSPHSVRRCDLQGSSSGPRHASLALGGHGRGGIRTTVGRFLARFARETATLLIRIPGTVFTAR